jgi:hypothetical protein
MSRRRIRARSDWWSPDTVEATLARLTPWNEDGSVSAFGEELNAAARRLVDAADKSEWSDADKEIALTLALAAVLDGLSEWALDEVQSYIARNVRPKIPWASIAGATNRAPDAARMRFDSRQAALREKRLAAQSK